MFDLITGTTQRPLRKRMFGPKVVSIAVHGLVATLVVVVPLLGVTATLPPMPTMMAFVASEPAPPPPPPPPAAPAPATQKAAPKETLNAVTTPVNPLAAPVTAPSEIGAEVIRPSAGVVGGVEGGVEGGVVGGIVGGIVGGVVAPPPPPPPPPPAPAPRGPVRIGGQLTAPALLKRVEPVYPDIAAVAHVTGVVILEATVGIDGCVQSVKVLRPRHPVLDHASVEALKQWRYTPLVLNGIPTEFVLTVTFSFSVGH